jgi:hypothetical protein
MKDYLFFFIILFFLVLIGIGIAALNDKLFIKSQAGNACPVPIISENSCPKGQIASLKQNSMGCYEIACK